MSSLQNGVKVPLTCNVPLLAGIVHQISFSIFI